MSDIHKPDDDVQLNAIVPESWRRWTRHRAIEENTTTGEIVVRALSLYRTNRENEPDPPDGGAAPLRLAA